MAACFVPKVQILSLIVTITNALSSSTTSCLWICRKLRRVHHCKYHHFVIVSPCWGSIRNLQVETPVIHLAVSVFLIGFATFLWGPRRVTFLVVFGSYKYELFLFINVEFSEVLMNPSSMKQEKGVIKNYQGVEYILSTRIM